MIPAPVGGACLGNFCDGNKTCTAAATCAPAPVLGDICATAGACGLLLDCIGGVCATPGGFGQRCAYQDPSPAAIDCLSP